MSKEIIEKAINILPYSEETIWEFIGGEPLLEPELIEFAINLLEKKNKKYIASITTNGTLFKDKDIRNLLENKPCKKSVGLSLDGPKYVHNMNRGNSFDDVMEYFDWWRKTFPWCATKSTIARNTLPFLSESVQFLISLGLTYIPINLVYEENWDEKDEQIYKEQLLDLSKFIKSNNLMDKITISQFSKTFINENTTKRNWCGCGEYMTAVDCNGIIYPCNRFIGTNLSIGNIDNGIDKNKVFPFLISHLKIDNCGNCEYMGRCPGCLAYDYQKTGSIFKRAKNNCNMNKIMIDVNKIHYGGV
jgi:radical SAM protein with 4Fe4S-binding SPASM domain